MSVWDELKQVLVKLRDEQPGTLMGYPMPDVDEGRQPPFAVELAPWATTAAEELYRRFGDDVDLTVGALPYPPGRQLRRPPATGQPAELLDPQQIVAGLDGPAVVRSGQTLRHSLQLRNLTGRELQIATTGQVTADVVDPRTGEVMGGVSGNPVTGGSGARDTGATSSRQEPAAREARSVVRACPASQGSAELAR